MMENSPKSNVQKHHSIVDVKNKSGKKCRPNLRQKMKAKLLSARFRFINEQLYRSEGRDTSEFFANDPEQFRAYHEGFRKQVDQWPVNPVEVIISSLQKCLKKKTLSIADFGCGEAQIAKKLTEAKVYSFDLVALNDLVTVCDMKKTNLPSNSIDVSVFCLSLMGSSISDYIQEANRVLRIGGILKIAEVQSRFVSIDDFVKSLKQFGFVMKSRDLSNNIFYFMDFKKVNDIGKKRKLPNITLKPCVYKKR